MSSIGKIFVVLNLVLAAVFVGWAMNAVSTGDSWKLKHETAVATAGKDKLALDAELSKVRADLGLTKSDNLSVISARDEAKRAQERLTTENSELTSANATLRASVTNIETTLGEIAAAREKAEADSKRAMTAQSEAEAARREALLAQQTAEEAKAAADAQLREIQNQVASLEKEKTKLINESASLKTSLDTLVATTGTSLASITAVEKIDGAVLGIDTSVAPGLVAINAGQTQGVRRGHTFEIFDGGTYKGQVKIEFVHADMSSGLITRTVPGQTIRQGDGASTRL